jgi:hypothetical protein
MLPNNHHAYLDRVRGRQPILDPLRTKTFLLSSYKREKFSLKIILDDMMILVYLLTAIGLTPNGSGAIHTHKQYTEQHNETEYTERNVHKNTNGTQHNNVSAYNGNLQGGS